MKLVLALTILIGISGLAHATTVDGPSAAELAAPDSAMEAAVQPPRAPCPCGVQSGGRITDPVKPVQGSLKDTGYINKDGTPVKTTPNGQETGA